MCVLLWDVAGDKRYEGLIEMNLRNLNWAAVFFNLNKRESFDRCNFFLDSVRDASSHAPLVLIGNRCDLEHKIDEKDIIELAKEYNAKYFEVSVKNGHNFEKAFDYLIAEVFDFVVDEKNRLLNLISSDK
ncbi:Ras- protein Rab-24 [Tritrichomonas musculus]|uniref:Ras- protein Rab-24 n=1 Tax=Tritrichomonas musculus TaxID=1915356 RepID=A0ABR2HCY2_9EUKA